MPEHARLAAVSTKGSGLCPADVYTHNNKCAGQGGRLTLFANSGEAKVKSTLFRKNLISIGAVGVGNISSGVKLLG